ncbi:eukaryotic translation initiation factor 4 gamma 3-like isoform X2 [Pangasianodon hypophthalmus]|uniref:eukaryotic translation initiation factor 4 gamma 3-like isoform X2 n=1 Tax=Pangasianodon hypophthalmus TaxID=310915 RepID=UPI0023074069|nr:eukaryotic translation initiation factor 4 gamma 3-like isoform X2 [Pangasianodon hypophthalmus]
MATPVRFHNGVKPGFLCAGVFYPTFQPRQPEALRLLQKRACKWITVRDPNDNNRDITAEIYGERMPSPLTAPHAGEVQCSSVNVAPAADVPPHDEHVKPSVPAEHALASQPSSDQEPIITIFGDILFESLAPTQPKWSDIVKARGPPKNTPPKKEEPNTAPASEEKPRNVLFCYPPIDEVQQKAEKANTLTGKKEKHGCKWRSAGSNQS